MPFTHQCGGKTKCGKRCKNMISESKLCHLHKNNEALNKWLVKEIKRINKNAKKYDYVDYFEPTVYRKGNNVVIVSFEEDEDPDQYFITTGTYPKRLKVDHIRIKEKKSETYIKKRYKSYKRDCKLESMIVDASL